MAFLTLDSDFILAKNYTREVREAPYSPYLAP